MSYREQVYAKVKLCQGEDVYTGPFRKLYFLETTTITNVVSRGNLLTTNYRSADQRGIFEIFKGTAIEGVLIDQFEIKTADQSSSSVSGNVLAYS